MKWTKHAGADRVVRGSLGVALAVTASLLLGGCTAGGDAEAQDVAQADVAASPAATPSPKQATPRPASTPRSAPTTKAETPATAATREPAAKPTSVTKPKPKPTKKPAAPAKPAQGSYISASAWESNRGGYAGTDVVLFFHASWCPKCRDTDASARAGMPAGLTLVKVNYDASNSLRQAYGVTLQHTFVQVDAGGSRLKKWVGTYDDNSVAWVKAQTI